MNRRIFLVSCLAALGLFKRPTYKLGAAWDGDTQLGTVIRLRRTLRRCMRYNCGSNFTLSEGWNDKVQQYEERAEGQRPLFWEPDHCFVDRQARRLGMKRTI